MNAERLLTHYERIADAPDAIPRLRRFILDLAVRGKLVPQDPNDEPASELLKRIATNEKRGIKENRSRRLGYMRRLSRFLSDGLGGVRRNLLKLALVAHPEAEKRFTRHWHFILEIAERL